MIEVDYIEFSMRPERFAEVFPGAFSLSNARPIFTFDDKRYVLLSAEWPEGAEDPIKCRARRDVYVDFSAPPPWTPGTEVPEQISVTVPVYRRWWQFWRPKILRHERRRYKVVGHVEAS